MNVKLSLAPIGLVDLIRKIKGRALTAAESDLLQKTLRAMEGIYVESTRDAIIKELHSDNLKAVLRMTLEQNIGNSATDVLDLIEQHIKAIV